MLKVQDEVRVWEDIVEIPTYGVGEPDKNPMFLEKRVYQGSSGKVYPLPVIDKIYDEKELKPYKILFLENKYLHIEIMPELGGRIYRALDKTNHYDFVYYNRVIKPALVGLAGPWISGGIEFNWPQHHRPNTFGPVEYRISENSDGSKTVWISEIDRMYGTKMTAGFTLYPDKAYLEIKGQLYNRTSEPQTFLWWANPAVAVNDHYQSVFPPDVHAVFDHGKRDVSKFPIATGEYYKVDYSAGVDISQYKNIPVPTSYMAYKSDFNFVGGYDHSVQAGILHIANHHISPGKKQWTWGNGEFGKAWDRNLTDEDGPYIELMTGVFTDNQPDFSWLMPYEEKTFTQYFMPYKHIGMVKNTTIDAAVNLEVNDHNANLQVYTMTPFENAIIELKSREKVYLKKTRTISPEHTFSTIIPLEKHIQAHDLRVTVYSAKGDVLVTYRPTEPKIEKTPDPAKAVPTPEELKNTEALYLAAQHLEQYRHATYAPDDYYLEGLKRDPEDIRLNNGYGLLLLRRGQFRESEAYLRRAIKTLTRHNPNPYDSEAYYNLGLSLKLQDRLEESVTAFYKAVWSAAWQDAGFFSLAQIASIRKNYREALELIDQSIMKNYRNYKARNLKTALLRKTGQLSQAEEFAKETLRFDIADFAAYHELYLIYETLGETKQADEYLQQLTALMRNDVHNYLALAQDYSNAGLYEEAADLLSRLETKISDHGYPMLYYTLGYIYQQMGNTEAAKTYTMKGQLVKPDLCFPNSLFDLIVLENALRINPEDARVHYYLGNLLYDKKRDREAMIHWETSVALDATFPTAYRNLALAYYNKEQNCEMAKEALEKAFQLKQSDARVFYELDQLYKKLGTPVSKRLDKLQEHMGLVQSRDDLYVEYVTLVYLQGAYKTANELINKRRFHPWEGGEGKVTAQYVLSHVEIAKEFIVEKQFREAIDELLQAKHYPDNLGEGKLAGAQENHIQYYLGCAYEGLGHENTAKEFFHLASQGLDEPTSAMFYNDQPPEMIFYQGLAHLKLNEIDKAKGKFNKLVDYGEEHIFKQLKIDYFAVSLPDFLVFEEGLQKKNEVHCRFMMGLGYLGLNKTDQAREQFQKVLDLEPSHQGTFIHLEMC